MTPENIVSIAAYDALISPRWPLHAAPARVVVRTKTGTHVTACENIAAAEAKRDELAAKIALA